MNPSRFHEQLYKFVRVSSPSIFVETGMATGLSALHILSAMELNQVGQLYSIESSDCGLVTGLQYERFHPVHGYSHEVMGDIFLETGPWDVFLHDSDHNAGCQTFEYETAWDFVKPGGFIMSDDVDWAGHRAWDTFLKRHSLFMFEPFELGCIRGVRKSLDAPVSTQNKDAIESCYEHAKRLANEANQIQFGKDYL